MSNAVISGQVALEGKMETTHLHEEDECVELKDVCGAVLTVRLLSLPSCFLFSFF